MDIDLLQGLGEIADDAPTPHLDPDSLWRAGVRRRNRRRGGTAAAVLASVALLTGGVLTVGGATHTDEPPVADDTSTGALPDRVWMPSPWTQGTDRAGDPGRIAVMFWDNGQRRSLGGSEGGGWVTVSALDGKYRYLDADGMLFDGSTPPELSPDGRYVAYPLLVEDTGLQGGIARATGWAVYDAQTGEVRRHLTTGTPLGVGVGASGLAWTPDSSTLLMDVCKVSEATDSTQSCDVERTDVWDLRSEETWTLPGMVAGNVTGASGGDLVVREDASRRVGLLDVRTGDVEALGRVGGGTFAEQVLGVDPSRRVATVATSHDDEDGVSLDVATQSLRPGGSAPTSTTVVEGATYVDVVDVLDDGRVLALTAGGSEVPLALRSFDAAGSESPEVVHLGRWGGALPLVATGLVDQPTTAGVRPPDIRDPRAGIGGIALAVGLAGGVGLVAWRRRRGPLGVRR